MRLIDADSFKTQIAAITIKNNLVVEKCNAICALIDKQPTAYNINQSIQRLKACEEYQESLAAECDEAGKKGELDLHEAKAEAYRNAIKIIKEQQEQKPAAR